MVSIRNNFQSEYKRALKAVCKNLEGDGSDSVLRVGKGTVAGGLEIMKIRGQELMELSSWEIRRELSSPLTIRLNQSAMAIREVRSHAATEESLESHAG